MHSTVNQQLHLLLTLNSEANIYNTLMNIASSRPSGRTRSIALYLYIRGDKHFFACRYFSGPSTASHSRSYEISLVPPMRSGLGTTIIYSHLPLKCRLF